jgi:glycosyltransferase involved in cell wall biosynthesis
MNIAIVAPSAVPFVMGGAEHLWLGLQRYINEETNHHCELFKVPTRENNLRDVVNSYDTHSALNFHEYDHLITGKYPAWMVNHRKHSLYMLHPLRGLYDTYHFSNDPTDFEFKGQALLSLKDAMNEVLLNPNQSSTLLPSVLHKLTQLLDQGAIDERTARFPGPFARKIVHFLDEVGLHPSKISSYAAISNTVASRTGYFPRGVKVETLYPPPRLEGFYCKSDDYLFTTSRLDGPKRIGLLIEAMHYVESNIQLLIGGTGPDEARLKQLAAGDKRIVFLGYLTDRQILDHYANCLAVPFVPYEEDYGLITIEAMRSSKPVLTTHDAGGVTEFVINGETGLVVAPDSKELAKAIDYLCTHRAEAKKMGRNAARKVSGIHWHPVAQHLLGVELKKSTPPARSNALMLAARQKIVVAVTFPIYPPRGGGQSRIYNLYKELARHYDITLVTLTDHSEVSFEGQIAPGLTEIRIPKTVEHQSIEDEYSRTVNWTPVTDIVAGVAIQATPNYFYALKKACTVADIVIASHPYFVKILRQCAPTLPLWFEAHNVELTLKKSLLPDNESASKLLQLVREDEATAWTQAEFVFACSDQDLKELESLYGPTSAKLQEVPNGFSSDEVSFTTAEKRLAIKTKIGLKDRNTVLFMGSWHGPNLDAVELILGYATALPTLTFLIIGSAGLKFASKCIFPNVKFLGVIDETEKQIILSSSDLAINPMTAGSGSNLKMLDYFAAGIPVLSTEFGARGIDVQPDVHYLKAEIHDFLFKLMDFFANAVSTNELCIRAAELAHTRYSWNAIAKVAHQQIQARMTIPLQISRTIESKKMTFDYRSHPKKVNLGCGFDNRTGYLNIDLNDFHGADLVSDVTRLDLLPSLHYEQAVANDVLEHIPRAKCQNALKEWNRILQFDGMLILQVPNVIGLLKLLTDADQQSFEAQNHLLQCLFGTQGYSGDFHYNGFTEVTLRSLLISSGFELITIKERDVWLFEVEAKKITHRERDKWIDAKTDEEFVRQAYANIIGRPVDVGGLAHNLALLSQGSDRETIVHILSNSPEFKKKTNQRLA